MPQRNGQRHCGPLGTSHSQCMFQSVAGPRNQTNTPTHTKPRRHSPTGLSRVHNTRPAQNPGTLAQPASQPQPQLRQQRTRLARKTPRLP
jgi:hypothetical protein